MALLRFSRGVPKLGGVEHVEDAFADGGDVGGARGVSVCEDDLAFVNGHHCGCGMRLEPSAENIEPCAGETCGFRFDNFPGGAGDDVAIAHVDGALRCGMRRGLREERKGGEETASKVEEDSMHCRG